MILLIASSTHSEIIFINDQPVEHAFRFTLVLA